MGLLARIFRQPSAPRAEGEELCTVLLPDQGSKWTGHLSKFERALQVELVAKPFEREQLDLRFADGVGSGACHVRVLLRPSEQTVPQRTQSIRRATELASALIGDGAIGVVIHRAGEVLYSADVWTDRTQGLAEPEWTPTLAWTDLGLEDGVLSTHGLGAFGLPEVGVELDHLGLSEDEAWARAREATLAAACTMVARGKALADGEKLRVIAGTESSGAPPSEDNLGLDEAAAKADTLADWRCEQRGDVIRLEPPPLLPLSKRFAVLQEAGMMPYPAYRWLFLERQRARGYHKLAQLWPRQLPGVPAHEVLIFEHEEGGRFLTTTCGLGRVAQPGGTADDENRFVELAVELPTHSPAIAGALGALAPVVHRKEPGSAPIGRGHRAALGGSAFPFEWVVFDALPSLDLGGLSPISMVRPLWMSATERDTVPLGRNAEWIEEHRAEALARWLHPVLPH